MEQEQWEYHVHTNDQSGYGRPISPALLQELGRKGWEMCGTYVKSQGQYAIYYFKRRLS